jgi:hypothetical protein
MSPSVERTAQPRACDEPATWGVCIALLFSAMSIGCVIPLSSNQPGADAGSPGNPTADGSSPGGGDAAAKDGGVPEAAIPTGKWTNVTGSLAGIPSVCGSIPDISVKPDEDTLIASVAGVGLWASRDGGDWEPLGTGTNSAMVTNRLDSITYDPINSNRYWESGVYGPGVFETNDDGVTFVELGNVQHCDLLAVNLADPDRQLMLLGGHEIAQTLYKSTDGGMNWTKIGGVLPKVPYCTLPVIIDPQTYLVGCYGSGPIGVYRSTDAGGSWKLMTSSGGGAAPLIAKDKTIYWTSPNNMGLTRSTDNGVTWKDIAGPGVVTTKTLVQLPDGRLTALGNQYILVSSDRGVTWTPVTSALPPNMMETVFGFTYSPRRKAFYIWQNHCDNGDIPVTTDAIMRYDFGG